jgi:hypothetical protein
MDSGRREDPGVDKKTSFKDSEYCNGHIALNP